jgi:hypothetical protein
MATARPSRVSSAAYTLPIPPSPRAPRISHGPSFVPTRIWSADSADPAMTSPDRLSDQPIRRAALCEKIVKQPAKIPVAFANFSEKRAASFRLLR